VDELAPSELNELEEVQEHEEEFEGVNAGLEGAWSSEGMTKCQVKVLQHLWD